jgi:hypothetical protein
VTHLNSVQRIRVDIWNICFTHFAAFREIFPSWIFSDPKYYPFNEVSISSDITPFVKHCSSHIYYSSKMNDFCAFPLPEQVIILLLILKSAAFMRILLSETCWGTDRAVLLLFRKINWHKPRICIKSFTSLATYTPLIMLHETSSLWKYISVLNMNSSWECNKKNFYSH